MGLHSNGMSSVHPADASIQSDVLSWGRFEPATLKGAVKRSNHQAKPTTSRPRVSSLPVGFIQSEEDAV